MMARARWALALAVLGLAAIGVTQGIPNRHAIEANLTQRSSAALEAAGISEAKVSFTGRDGSVGVPRKSDLDKVRSIVGAVNGVRVVTVYALPNPTVTVTIAAGEITSDSPIPNDLLLVAQALAGPGEAKVELRDGHITLSGRVPPFARDAAVSAAADLVGPSNVDDQLALLPPPPPMPPEEVGRELGQLPPITFANDSATLTPAAQAIVVRAAELLRLNPFVHIRIEGHTDSNGTPAANLKLSQTRAQSVLNALVALGIQADRLSAVGYGAQRPKVPDTTPAAHAINRRVEFVVVLP